MLTNTNIGLNQFIVKGDYALIAYDFDIPLLVQRRLSAESSESFFEMPYRGGPLINVFLSVYFWRFCR